jgi:hypothetical protein
LVKANGFILVSESLPGIISASSKAVKYSMSLMYQVLLCRLSQIAQTVSVCGYSQVGEEGKDETQIEWRRWIQLDKSTSRNPDALRTVDLRK